MSALLTADELAAKAASVDWDAAEANTRYLTHGIHRYSSKFIPQVARAAIELVSLPGETVLDCFCGSGTTLLEAALIGRRSIGVDLSPLAVLIAKVKTTRMQPAQLLGFAAGIEEQLRYHAGGQRPLWTSTEVIDNDLEFDQLGPWAIKWFQDRPRRELLMIYRVATAEPNDNLRNVALVAFSDILRRSSNAHQGYPNLMLDRRRGPIESPIRLFIRRLREVISSIVELSDADLAPVEVNRGDATALNLEDASVDAVVTHPPYVGSVPYAEYGELSLRWLGHDPRDLDGRLLGGRRQSSDVVQRFEDGLRKTMGEIYRVLLPQRYCFLLVGNPTVRGTVVDLSKMTTESATEAGFRLVGTYSRRALNRRANKMAGETALFFEKPGYSSLLASHPSENSMASAAKR
jgi:hypothetical protein